MSSKVLEYMGINIDTIKGKENVETAIDSVKKENVLQGLYNLFSLSNPGTDIEVTVDFGNSKPLTLHFKIEEESRQIEEDAA